MYPRNNKKAGFGLLFLVLAESAVLQYNGSSRKTEVNLINVLILSCHTGGGHDAAAEALAEAFRRAGHKAVRYDFFGLHSQKAETAASDIYVGTVNHSPKLFQALYRVGSAISSPRRHSPVYYANAYFAPALEAMLKKEPFDLAVTTHIFPAHALTWLKARGRTEIPFAGVMTDYTCIPFWEETRCDLYITPHPYLTEEIVRRGIPAEKIFPLGIPVSPALSDEQPGREALGLKEDVPLVTMLSGSMGHGNLGAIVDALLREGGQALQIAVIAGRNEKLKQALESRYGSEPQVFIKGFENMPPWLQNSDVLITKPGGLTITGAAAVRVPLVLANAIPGCETANQEFFVSRGMAAAPDTPDEQARAALGLCGDRKARERMRAAQAQAVRPDNARQICGLLLEKFGGGGYVQN